MRLVASVVLTLVAYASGPEASAPARSERAAPEVVSVVTAGTAERPYELKVPEGYDEQEATPLVVLLHGYSSSGAAQNAYFGLSRVAERETFLLAYPDGTTDRVGNRFWNATDACCDFFNSGVDDVAYLDAVIDEIAGRYTVDQQRIYLVGHSNGAFMSHRLACDRAGRIAAIVTLAGMQWADANRCPAGSPVSVLHVHGTEDRTVRYHGGSTPKGPYPGAVETAAAWAAKNGCTGTLQSTGDRVDLEAKLPGEETRVERYSGCAAGAVELWTIESGSHVPTFNQQWADRIWQFAAAHPKRV